MKKVMISQPMANLKHEEIVETKERAITALKANGFRVMNTLFVEDEFSSQYLRKSGVVRQPVFFLSRAILIMSKCHAIYFCKGWEKARGCQIEHAIALAYGLEIIHEGEKIK